MPKKKAKPKEAPATLPERGRQAYDVRVVRKGEQFEAIRFKPDTGETWRAQADRWVRIQESTAVPAGDYDVIMVATEQAFTALRFDRVSGKAWLYRPSQWIRIKEQGDNGAPL